MIYSISFNYLTNTQAYTGMALCGYYCKCSVITQCKMFMHGMTDTQWCCFHSFHYQSIWWYFEKLATTQQYVVSTDVVWTDVVSTDVVSTDVVWTDVVWTDVVWTDVVSTDVVSTDVVSTDVVSTDMVSTDVVSTDVVSTDVVSTDADSDGLSSFSVWL